MVSPQAGSHPFWASAEASPGGYAALRW